MLLLMNAARLEAGLIPLAMDAGVSDTARRHSAARRRSATSITTGRWHGGVAQRAACGTAVRGEHRQGVERRRRRAASRVHGGAVAADQPPHELMDPSFRRAGIGAVQGPDAVYVTVVFCR